MNFVCIATNLKTDRKIASSSHDCYTIVSVFLISKMVLLASKIIKMIPPAFLILIKIF